MIAQDRGQIPTFFDVTNANKITQPWAMYFAKIEKNLPKAGTGYVIDGSATRLESTLYQGDVIDVSPKEGGIFISTGTGETFVEKDGVWLIHFPNIDGDVIIDKNSTTSYLKVVNNSPQVLTFRKYTINSKGLVTDSSSVLGTDITDSLGYIPVNKAGDTMLGDLILNREPIIGLQSSTKSYDNKGILSLVNTSTNYTVLPTDNTILANGNIVITLPNPNSIEVGKTFNIKSIGAINVTVIPTASLIDGNNNIYINNKYASMTVISDGSNYYII